MLPPGHVAAGFFTAEAILHIFHPNLSHQQLESLLAWGIFWSFAPDLDTFLAYYFAKSFWFKSSVDNPDHRKFYSHTPILWLAVAVAGYFLSKSVYYKIFWTLFLTGSFTHFLLDSIEYGIPWLWPFNKQLWALTKRGVAFKIEAKNFFDYWTKFLKAYSKSLTFYSEVIILISIIVYYFK